MKSTMDEFPEDVNDFYDKVFRGAELKEGQIISNIKPISFNPDYVLISNGKIEYVQFIKDIPSLISIETGLDSAVAKELFELGFMTVKLEQKCFEAHLHNLPEELEFKSLAKSFLSPEIIGRKDQLLGLLIGKRDKMNQYVEALTNMPDKYLFANWYFQEKGIASADDEVIKPIEDGQKLFNLVAGGMIGAKTYTRSEMQELIEKAGENPENDAENYFFESHSKAMQFMYDFRAMTVLGKDLADYTNRLRGLVDLVGRSA